ncbi:MAG TPA: universal stress protein [Steroidobacteraceae bacterium]|nr:universal stress protein [Steroidobacteraceae bacterium]
MRLEPVPEMACPLHVAKARRIGRILVVVDPTATVHPCVEKAARIATGIGATLELFVCDVLQEGDGAARAQREERAHAQLQALAAPLRGRGLVVECRCEWHAPLEQGIGLRVLRSGADFVVKDTHSHVLDGMRGGYGLTDWTLIRQIPVPLLLVRATPWPSRPHVTVGIDPLHPAQRPAALDEEMVQLAGDVARATRGTVDALHVLQEPPHLPGDPVTPEARALAHDHAREECRQLVARARDDTTPVDLHFTRGRIAPGVLGFVAAHATDILVLGSGAHSRWRQTGASGTAAQILEFLACDLLVVRPPGYLSPLLVTDDE